MIQIKSMGVSLRDTLISLLLDSLACFFDTQKKPMHCLEYIGFYSLHSLVYIKSELLIFL